MTAKSETVLSKLSITDLAFVFIFQNIHILSYKIKFKFDRSLTVSQIMQKKLNGHGFLSLKLPQCSVYTITE